MRGDRKDAHRRPMSLYGEFASRRMRSIEKASDTQELSLETAVIISVEMLRSSHTLLAL